MSRIYGYARTSTQQQISKGEPCIDIIDANDKYNYDDYQGWKGLVAYCTKKMYNPDMMLEVFDNQNSTLTIKR